MTANEASAEPDPLADPRVFRAVQEYQAELDAGRRPNRAAFLARHPEAAGVLSGCLRGLDLLVAVAPGTPRPAEPGGTRFEDYRVVRERGRGGLSVVYEAEQLSLRRRVALKVLSAPADATARRRFRNEAYAAASLRHPHIVPVYAVEVDAEPPFLVMPLVAGSSLAALVRGLREATGAVADTTVEAAGAVPHAPEPPSAERPAAALPGDRDHHRAAARLARQAADALQHAHESGIVHRDIKPGNLLVEPGGHLWVADFGMAKSAAAGDLTRTGEVVGTLRYMSPEQATGEAAVDHRTDVYALGVTLYELLTLRPAFPGDDLRAVFRAVASAEPPPPRRIAPAIPRELETVVLKAMAKERADRYATAAEFAADLQRFLDDRPVLARRPSPARRARKWVWRNRAPVAAGLATLVAVLIAGVVGLAVTADRIRDEQKQTAGANAELTKTVDERDGALRRLNQAHADQAVALRQARAAEYAHAFFAARAEWRAGNFARAADLLRQCPPECRRWEWAYLTNLLDTGLFALPGPARVVANMANTPLVFSPDGTRLADTNRSVQVWELPAGAAPPAAPRWTFARPNCVYLAAAFAPDGQHLVAVGYDGKPLSDRYVGELHVWQLGTGELVRSVALPGKPLALAADGARVLCAPRYAANATAQLIDAADGVPVPGFRPVPATAVHVAAFSPTGKYLLIAAGREANLFDAQTGKLLRTFPGSGFYGLGRSAFSPDERFLAGVTDDFQAKTWELTTGREVHVLRGRTAHAVGFSPDGRRLATTGSDGTADVWDIRAAGGVLAGRTKTYHGPNGAPTFHPDGVRFAATDARGGITVWDATTAQEGRILPRERAFQFSFAVAADGARLFSPGLVVTPGRAAGYRLRQIDLATGRERTALAQPIGPLSTPVVGTAGVARLGSPDGLFVHRPANAGWALRAATGREWPLQCDGVGAFAAAAVSPDGGTFAGVARNGKVVEQAIRLVDTATGVPRGELAVGTAVNGLAVHPRDPLLAVACADRTVRVFDTRTVARVRELTGHTGAATAVAYHPGGALLASVGADGTARLWDARTGEPGPVLDAHAGALSAVAFTADGDRLAVALPTGGVQVWDHKTVTDHLTLPSPRTQPLKALAFTPDGAYLIGDDGTELVVWDAAPASRATKAARLAAHVADWREKSATAFESGRDWFPAVFHLERLVAREPDNAEYRKRLEKARTALAAPPTR